MIKNDPIILDVPDALPEGTRVEVLPTTPEGIDALLERMEQVESGWLSSEDDAVWRAALRAQKRSEKAPFLEEAEVGRKTLKRGLC
jgi:hypothetical protein